jgi:hypothetical protein
MAAVKTTLDLDAQLLQRARKLAKRTHRPLRAVVEEGLRRVLAEPTVAQPYRLADCSVGDPDGDDPLERMTWQELRDEIYGGR